MKVFTTPADVGLFSSCSPVGKRNILIIGCQLGKETDYMNNDEDHNGSDYYTWSTKQPQGMGCKTWNAPDN